KRPAPVDDPVEKRPLFLDIRVLAFRQRDSQRQQTASVVARIGGTQAQEALQRQPGADKKHQREGNLTDHEGTSESLMRSAAQGWSSRFQRLTDVRLPVRNRGSATEQKTGDNGYTKIEAQHSPVEGDEVGVRQLFYPEHRDELHPPDGRQQGDGPTQESQEQAFD